MGKRKVRERNKLRDKRGPAGVKGRETLKTPVREREEEDVLEDRNRDSERERQRRGDRETERRGWRERHMTPGDGNEWRHRSASHPPSSVLGIPMREGPTFLWGTHQRNTGAKDAGLMVVHFQVLGGRDAASQRWQGDLLPHPSTSNSTRRGRSTRPPPQGSLLLLPSPVSACFHRCLPALPSHLVSWRADSSRCLLVISALSVFLCYSTHSTSLSSSAGYPASPRSRCPHVMLSTCLLLLSVCPRPAAGHSF